MYGIPPEELIRAHSTAYTVLGYLSFLSSVMVLLTYALFRKSFKDKYFMSLVFLVSFCDFGSGLVSTFGFTTDTTLCAVQGAFVNFFFRASWFFTSILSYQLRYLVLNGSLDDRFNLRKSNLIVWTISIILEILPLATQNYYGADDEWIGLEPCYIMFNGRHRNSRNYIIFVTFAIPLLLSLSFMLYNSIVLLRKYRAQMSVFKHSYPAINAAIEQSYMYPLALLFCWFPCFILFIVYVIADGVVSYTFENIAYEFDVSYGLFMSLIFFTRSKIAKREWSKFFDRIKAGQLFSSDSTSSKTNDNAKTLAAADQFDNPIHTMQLQAPSSSREASTLASESLENGDRDRDRETRISQDPIVMISGNQDEWGSTRYRSTSELSEGENQNSISGRNPSGWRLFDNSVYFAQTNTGGYGLDGGLNHSNLDDI